MRFPNLCILAVSKDAKQEPIGCVVGKVDYEEEGLHHHQAAMGGEDETTFPAGYIGMLAVSKEYRRRGIGKALVQRVVHRMKKMGCQSVTLETEGESESVCFESDVCVCVFCFGFNLPALRILVYLLHVLTKSHLPFHQPGTVSNVTAHRLYQDSFGFIREELLVRYYLNFGDAYRLRLWF